MKTLEFLSQHRHKLLFAAALGLGGLAAFGARGYLSEQLAIERERLLPRQPMTQVVVAKRDLARGEAVSADTMAVREMPSDYLPSGAVPPDRFDTVAGATLVQPMRAGEPLQQSAVAAPDGGAFSARLRNGVRALTISVDEVNSLSGMLQPGDRIDLMLSVRLPGGSGTPMPQEITRALLQDVRVLATGRQMRPGGDERQPGRSYTAITIEVTPEQAQRMVVAQRSGKITALLRSPGDREPVAQRPMDVYRLLDLKPAEAAPPAAQPPELIVGGQGALRPADRLAQALAQQALGGQEPGSGQAAAAAAAAAEAKPR